MGSPGYRWEKDYEKTWESIKEQDGLILPSVDDIIKKNKRSKLFRKRVPSKLGIMRHVFVILDYSEPMMRNDLKPTRIACTLRILELFLSEFSDLNPISQVGIILTRNKKFELLSPMTSDMKAHINSLNKLKGTPCSGEPSLQNSLEAALTTLKHLPNHTSKEILIIMGSLTTCDPGDIHSTIQSLVNHNIRCSVVGLAAKTKVLEDISKGNYQIALDEAHYKDIMFEHLNPPPAKKGTQSSLIRMGFSQYIHDDQTPAMCACHYKLTNGGYYCCQCQAKYAQLPVGCNVCGLTLVSAAHLARSFHHLFPVELFEEIRPENDPIECNCFACDKPLIGEASKCSTCDKLYCLDCHLFISEILHYCPACK